MAFQIISNLRLNTIPDVSIENEFTEFTESFRVENPNCRFRTFAEIKLFATSCNEINGESYAPARMYNPYINWEIFNGFMEHINPIDDYCVTTLDYCIRDFLEDSFGVGWESAYWIYFGYGIR